MDNSGEVSLRARCRFVGCGNFELWRNMRDRFVGCGHFELLAWTVGTTTAGTRTVGLMLVV